MAVVIYHMIQQYLNKQQSSPLTDDIPVTVPPDLIVVIPCYNEPDVLTTLESLIECDRNGFNVEMLIMINSWQSTPESVLLQNRNTWQLVKNFAIMHNTDNFHIIPLLVEHLPDKYIGAGLPRKLGMDEALRRFVRNRSTTEVIVSLDADCTVEPNYLSEIYRHFAADKKLLSATIQFHHPTEHLSKADPLRQAVELYEKYLRDYRQMLASTGFPYPYFTIGSAFAVRAKIYAQAGGMGKQQAGEDFYFLQKVFPLGKSQFIDTTVVYPAARLSDRVPFGTGPAVAKIMVEGKKEMHSREAFRLLTCLFADLEAFYQADTCFIEQMISQYESPLKQFLIQDGFVEKMVEIKQYTASFQAFRKRFFNYFNAFKIVKYLNFVHPVYFRFEKCK